MRVALAISHKPDPRGVSRRVPKPDVPSAGPPPRPPGRRPSRRQTRRPARQRGRRPLGETRNQSPPPPRPQRRDRISPGRSWGSGAERGLGSRASLSSGLSDFAAAHSARPPRSAEATSSSLAHTPPSVRMQPRGGARACAHYVVPICALMRMRADIPRNLRLLMSTRRI